MFNSVAGVILYPYMTSSVRDAIERDSTESISHAKSILSEMGKVVSSSPETEGAENSSLPRDTASNKRLFCFSISFHSYNSLKRKKRRERELSFFLKNLSFGVLIVFRSFNCILLLGK